MFFLLLLVLLQSVFGYEEVLQRRVVGGFEQIVMNFRHAEAPRNIRQLFHAFPHLHSFELSFGQQRWDYEEWGLQPTGLEKPMGVYLKVEHRKNSSSRLFEWDRFVQVLGGMFCASLSLLKEADLVMTSVGDMERWEGLMPREAVCTENLTPWAKLLPCGGQAGLGKLLIPRIIYNSRYFILVIQMCCRYNLMMLQASRQNDNVVMQQRMHVVLTRETDLTSNLVDECLVPVKREELEKREANVHVSRHCQSHSAEHGMIHFDLESTLEDSPSSITIEQHLPWQMTLYLHKLPKDIHITLQQAITRKRGTVITLTVPITENKKRRVSLEYDLPLLKYTEYPIDPHRGLDIAPAKVTGGAGVVQWTMPSLVRMPVPDFSMPYNVITITCTLLALFHGQLFNRLTRSFSITQQAAAPEKPLRRFLKVLLVKIKDLL